MKNLSYRMTFNKPAGRQFLDGYAGVSITFDRRGVFFKPMKVRRGENFAAILPRGERGGFETTIDGSEAKALLRTLSREATPTQPFFLLVRDEADHSLLKLVHFKSMQAPPKVEPHVRLWSPQEKAKDRRREATERTVREGVLGFVDEVRDANETLRDHKQQNRIGRPSKEVEHATAVMREFDTLVREIRPTPMDAIDLDPSSMAMVADVLGTLAKAMTPKDAIHGPAATAAAIKGSETRSPAAPATRAARARKVADPAPVPAKRRSATKGRAKAEALASEDEQSRLPLADDTLPPSPIVPATAEIVPTSARDSELRRVPDDEDMTPEERDVAANAAALSRLGTSKRKATAPA